MNWEIIAPIVLTILLLFAGGYIRKLIKEAHEFFAVLQDAIEDGKITPGEMVKIIKEAKDLKNALLEIAKALQRR